MRPFLVNSHKKRCSPFLVWGFYLASFDVYLGHYFPHYTIVASAKCIFHIFFCVCALLFWGVGEREYMKLCEKGGGILEELWQGNKYEHFLKNLKLKKEINICAAKMTVGQPIYSQTFRGLLGILITFYSLLYPCLIVFKYNILISILLFIFPNTVFGRYIKVRSWFFSI